jgi:hypothetical protein
MSLLGRREFLIGGAAAASPRRSLQAVVMAPNRADS